VLNAKYNRARATRKIPGGCSDGAFSRDEFPFATTFEGGDNAWCRCVPIYEQWIQRQHNLEFFRGKMVGFQFEVKLIGNLKIDPLPENVPQHRPFPFLPIVFSEEFLFLLFAL